MSGEFFKALCKKDQEAVIQERMERHEISKKQARKELLEQKMLGFGAIDGVLNRVDVNRERHQRRVAKDLAMLKGAFDRAKVARAESPRLHGSEAPTERHKTSKDSENVVITSLASLLEAFAGTFFASVKITFHAFSAYAKLITSHGMKNYRFFWGVFIVAIVFDQLLK